MIIDSIQKIETYAVVNKRFEKVASFLASNDLTSMFPGRYPVDGDNIFLTISENDLKSPADAKLEAHREYIDIQIVLAGIESFGWKSLLSCQAVSSEYNPEKDIMFFADTPDTYFSLQSGQFAIFFPEDAHAPLVQAPIGNKRVVKAIFKVRV